jgi:Ca2+-binding EF-hand superfamily protein
MSELCLLDANES